MMKLTRRYFLQGIGCPWNADRTCSDQSARDEQLRRKYFASRKKSRNHQIQQLPQKLRRQMPDEVQRSERPHDLCQRCRRTI